MQEFESLKQVFKEQEETETSDKQVKKQIAQAIEKDRQKQNNKLFYATLASMLITLAFILILLLVIITKY